MFFFKKLIDLLFPIRCFGCGSYDEWICDQCARRFCGAPRSIGGQLLFNRYMARVYTFADYHDPLVSKVVSAFKYQFAYTVGVRVGELMAEQLKRRLALYPDVQFDAVIPVPLAHRRRRWRGFNQSEILAASISRRYHWPLVTSAVCRTRFTELQMTLPAARRRSNVSNAFVVTDSLYVAGKRILLVDDVITTGATCNECAKTLLNAGAEDVWVVAFARG